MNHYYTTQQLSELWSISPNTLRKWRWEGKGPRFVKLGNRVVYRREDIETYASNQLRHSTTDTGGLRHVH